MGTSNAVVELHALRERIRGTVLARGDAGYDDARAGWNANVDHRPVAIVRPASAADIAAAVRFARAAELPLAVQATGHGAVLPCHGLLIATSEMTSISIDRETRIATVGAGVRWGDLNRTAHRDGLVGLAGFVPTVGVVGYSLGGGIGWFTREFGYASDAIVGATLVLADGTIVEVDERAQPELLWALRGGSGNFGIVASLSIRCQPVSTVYGGKLTFGLEAGRDVLRRFVAWSQRLPDAFTPSLTIRRMPPLPDVPDAVRGRIALEVGVCFNGTAADGEALMAAWDDARPVSRELGRHRTSELDAIEAGPPGALRAHSVCAEFVELPEAATDRIVAAFERTSPLRMVEIRVLGGATARSSREGAAGDGDARYVVHVQSALDDPATRDAARLAARSLVDALAPYATGGVSLSFLPDGAEGVALVRRAFDDATFARLAALKARYDPTNALRLNYNIAPQRAPAATGGDATDRR